MSQDNLSEPVVVARLRDYRQTFGTQAGRRVLGDLFRSYLYKQSHVSGDPYQTAFNEGARHVVLKLRAALKMSEEELERWTEAIHKQQQLEDER